MKTEQTYPCPCGGKIKWKKEKVIQEGIDCGILDIEYCEHCKEEYFPESSMTVIEEKLKAASLWGVQRKEIKFWKTGSSVTIRLPSELVKKTSLSKIKKGYIYQEGEHKISIEY